MDYHHEWKNWVVGESREWEVSSLPKRHEDEESAGGVGMWARTDSPATHHFPTITAQLTSGILMADTWIFPIGSWFNISPSLTLGNHALFI